MKHSVNAHSAPLVTAGLGGIALALRQSLYAFGTDHKGLLIPLHPLELGLWLVAAVAVCWILLSLKKDCTSSPLPAAAGYFAFAVGIGVTALLADSNSSLAIAAKVSALPVIPALAYVGLCRKSGNRPHFLCHGLLCIHLILYTICHYQLWSSHPQLQDAFFPMMGCIFLMLSAYYHTARDVDMGKAKLQLVFGLLAGFCCITAISGNDPLFYVTGALWALTNLNPTIKEV